MVLILNLFMPNFRHLIQLFYLDDRFAYGQVQGLIRILVILPFEHLNALNDRFTASKIALSYDYK